MLTQTVNFTGVVITTPRHKRFAADIRSVTDSSAAKSTFPEEIAQSALKPKFRTSKKSVNQSN
jgi:hypothetical protein